MICFFSEAATATCPLRAKGMNFFGDVFKTGAETSEETCRCGRSLSDPPFPGTAFKSHGSLWSRSTPRGFFRFPAAPALQECFGGSPKFSKEGHCPRVKWPWSGVVALQRPDLAVCKRPCLDPLPIQTSLYTFCNFVPGWIDSQGKAGNGKSLALVPEWSIFPPSANIREVPDVVRN